MLVLFVCTGNLCRSPMAEGLLRRELERRGCEDIEVRSAGTWAAEGSPATSGAQEVMTARGVDVAAHRSRALDGELLERADLVVAMTSVHTKEILSLERSTGPKVVLLKELPHIAERAEAQGDIGARVKTLIEADRPAPSRGLDLDDPMGLPIAAYERAAREIEAGVDALADVLCPRRGPRSETGSEAS